MPTASFRIAVSLVLGTLVFVVIVTLLQIPRFGESRGEGQALRWTGEELHALGLDAEVRGGAVWLRASETSVQGVVTTGPVSFEAVPADVLRLHAKGLHPATGARVFWRTSAAPRAFESLAVEMTPGGRIAIGMGDVFGWSGTVTEVGLLVTGVIPEPIELRYIAVEPLTPGSLWPVLWTQWFSFQPWRHASINFLNVSRGSYLSPVVAAALWIVIVWACYRWLPGRRSWSWRWAFSVFLVAWVVLDLRFQADLLFKLWETRFTYAGKDVEERLASGPDAALYNMAQQFLDQVDTTDSRVFVVSDEPQAVRGYKRYRTHYFLLPANAFSMSRNPPASDRLLPGDVILVIGPHAKLRFDDRNGELAWTHQSRVKAIRLYENADAAAYRVQGRVEGSAE